MKGVSSVTVAPMYDEMLERLRASMRNEMALREGALQAQLSALQMQINPHFIYNTLNIISAKGMESGSEEISDLCDQFAQMLRYSTDARSRTGRAKYHLYAEQSPPGSRPADSQTRKHTAECRRQINARYEREPVQTYIPAAFHIYIRHRAEAVHYTARHRPQDGVHHYEDYRALADPEPQDSQRQQRHTGQQVAYRHY